LRNSAPGQRHPPLSKRRNIVYWRCRCTSTSWEEDTTTQGAIELQVLFPPRMRRGLEYRPIESLSRKLVERSSRFSGKFNDLSRQSR
jgi:hypothetical protein